MNKEYYSNELDLFVKADVLHGRLKGKIEKIAKSVQLFWENERVQTTPVVESEFSFKLTESGRYRVRVFDSTENSVFSTKYLEILMDRDLKEFEKLKNVAESPKLDKCFYKGKRPCKDFSIAVCNKDLKQRKEELSGLHIKTYVEGNNEVEVITTSKLYDKEGVAYLSGYVLSDNFIDSEVECDGLLKTIEDELGVYTAITRRGNALIISKDYLGIGLLFLYQSVNVKLISNRYELLLMHAKRLDEKLSIDEGVLKRQIAYHPWPSYTAQAFSNDLLIKNCRLLNPYEYAVIENGNLHIRQTSLFRDLSESSLFNEQEYTKEIKLAARDIINNIKITFDHFPSANFIYDVTGGLDSRVLFCALSHFPENKERVFANTIPIKNNPGDVNISTALTNIYPLNYYNNKKKIFNPKKDDYIRRLSYSLGIYNDVAYRSKEEYDSELVRVVGYFGELSRIYMTRKYYNEKFDSIEDYITNLFSKLQIYRTFDSEILYKEFNNILIGIIDSLPGKGPFEKMENFYLFYRNRIHGNPLLQHNNAVYQVAPFQSRHIIRARHMAINILPTLQVESDLIKVLNPVLSKVHYASNKDNQDIKSTKDFCELASPEIDGLNISYRISRDNFESTENLTEYECSEAGYWDAFHKVEKDLLKESKEIIGLLYRMNFLTEIEARSVYARLVCSFSSKEKFGWAKWRMINFLYNFYYHIMLLDCSLSDISIKEDIL